MIDWIGPEQDGPVGAKIKVVGVGGGGGNAINNMIEAALGHVSYAVANTDQQALARSLAVERLQIGGEITRGLGAGANPDIGQRAALEDEEGIRTSLQGADMVFVTAGMGGGTGTGAAPVIAQIARDAGALTVAVVTRPFAFEGKARARRAERGLRELADAVDTLIIIPNDRLLDLADDGTTFTDSFKMADSVLLEAVRGICDIILTPGLINVDFADVVTIMKGKGMALMGTGCATGPDRARLAAQQAISSPLLEDVRIESATGLLVNITGGNRTSLREVNAALTLIQDAVHEDTDTIFGAVVDPTMGEEMRITVVATGFERENKRAGGFNPTPPSPQGPPPGGWDSGPYPSVTGMVDHQPVAIHVAQPANVQTLSHYPGSAPSSDTVLSPSHTEWGPAHQAAQADTGAALGRHSGDHARVTDVLPSYGGSLTSVQAPPVVASVSRATSTGQIKQDNPFDRPTQPFKGDWEF